MPLPLPNSGLGWHRTLVGMVSKFAVLGSPIAHSLSPIIHAAAYKALDLAWSYEKFDLTGSQFDEFMKFKSNDFRGFSVTMPLKEQAFKFAKGADSVSQLTNLSNTLLRTENGWVAFNTDVYGIEQTLRVLSSPDIRNILIIGSGATARSAAVAVSRKFAQAGVSILGRNSERVEEFEQFALGLGIIVAKFDSQQTFDLTISTVPAAAFESFEQSLRKVSDLGTLFDVAYNPWPSAAAQFWQKIGSDQISGINMLVWQAIAQIRIFVSGNLEAKLQNEAELASLMLEAAAAVLN